MSRRRKARAFDEVEEPLQRQFLVAWLSVLIATFASVRSTSWARISSCSRLPANLMSELVMEPVGCWKEHMLSQMCCINASLHYSGG